MTIDRDVLLKAGGITLALIGLGLAGVQAPLFNDEQGVGIVHGMDVGFSAPDPVARLVYVGEGGVNS